LRRLLRRQQHGRVAVLGAVDDVRAGISSAGDYQACGFGLDGGDVQSVC
jgi:hypothetical protein